MGIQRNVWDNPTTELKRYLGLHERVGHDWWDWVLGPKGCVMGFALGYLTMMTACRETQTRYNIWRPHSCQRKLRVCDPWSYDNLKIKNIIEFPDRSVP